MSLRGSPHVTLFGGAVAEYRLGAVRFITNGRNTDLNAPHIYLSTEFPPRQAVPLNMKPVSPRVLP